MELNKQTVIQAEWIEAGHEPSSWSENGFVDVDFLPDYIDVSKLYHEKIGGNLMARPKTLHGIENNNGWVKIYCENDMPQFDCYCFIIDKVIGLIASQWKQAPNETEDKEARSYWLKHATHYKIIEKPLLPFY